MRPKPIASPKCETRFTHCHLLACYECGSPTVLAESGDVALDTSAFRGGLESTCHLMCTSCGARMSVVSRVRDIDNSLAQRCRDSLEDPEQKARDARANAVLTEARAVEQTAQALRDKAAKLRRGEL